MAEVANEVAREAVEGTEAEFQEEGPINKKKLIIIGLLGAYVLVVAIAIWAVIALVTSSTDSRPPPAVNQAAMAPQGVDDEDAFGEAAEEPAPKKKRRRLAGTDAVNVALKAFVINLADADAPRYLKVDITLQVIDKEAEREVEEYNAMVRDTVLAYLSGLSAEQTVGPLGKSDMRHAIKKRINDVLPSAPVERVFFTQFIVQWERP